MEHTIVIYKKNKSTGGMFIDGRVKFTQEEVEELALFKFKDQYSSRIDEEKYEYKADLEETKH